MPWTVAAGAVATEVGGATAKTKAPIAQVTKATMRMYLRRTTSTWWRLTLPLLVLLPLLLLLLPTPTPTYSSSSSSSSSFNNNHNNNNYYYYYDYDYDDYYYYMRETHNNINDRTTAQIV